jgi:hypothetical protein
MNLDHTKMALMDAAMAKVAFSSSSVESEIDREIEKLVRKIIAGDVTAKDMQELRDLQKRRVYRMQPKICRKKRAVAAA